ncbi:MAG TPA: hypothetical protein VFB08_00155 [Burkholderiales bacterium]|nr:hypothetical protein [Burkholderiales bacterium]
MLTRRIRTITVRNIARYHGAPAAAIESRMESLGKEWTVERAVMAGAGLLALAGAALLLEHALTGWCPAVPLLRRLGFRTRREVEAERLTLRRMLRG